ncbi:MAG: IPT/TIG domain-containing protein [Bacteroidales bacterium]|nr:IPT/TIG domain-containing protein [Bacteroidales bacterium]
MKSKLNIIWVIVFVLVAGSCEEDASVKTKEFAFIISQQPEKEADGYTIYAELVKPDSDVVQQHGFVMHDETGSGSEYSCKVIINPPVQGKFSYHFNSGLKAGKKYYVRAFAETNSYISYSNEVNFVSEYCEPPEIAGFNPSSGKTGSQVVITGSYFSPSANGNTVTFGNMKAIVDSATENRLVVTVPKVTKPDQLILSVENESGKASSTETFHVLFPWIKKNGFSGTPVVLTSTFEINGIIYLCGGARTDVNEIMKEFWEFDPVSDKWTRKPDFPGEARNNAISFSCNGKGYYGMGTSSSWENESYLTDLWEYDPVTENWSQKVDFPGIPVIYTKSFTINNKAYTGPGYYWESGNNHFVNEFWEYDPLKNSWTKKKEFPGAARYFGIAISTETKGYLGCGSNGWPHSEFYEYDPVMDSWLPAGNYPGKGYNNLACFSIKGKLYMGLGRNNSSAEYNDLWEYDPVSRKWNEMNPCPTAFSPEYNATINDKGYTGNCSGYSHSIFYEFDIDQAYK